MRIDTLALRIDAVTGGAPGFPKLFGSGPCDNGTSRGDCRVLILLPGATSGSVGDLLAIGLQRLGAGLIKHGIKAAFECRFIITMAWRE